MRFLRKLETFDPATIILIASVQICVLGVVDYFTGFELSFAVFYLIPVTLAAWSTNKKVALLVAFGSAVMWNFANTLAGEVFSNPLIPIWNASTRLGFFLVVAVLIARLKDSMLQEAVMARTDFLTGAANPRSFYEIAQDEIDRSIRYKHDLSLVYLDADNFKYINDSLGHHVGSDLLVRLVEVVKKNLRASDTVARAGGDEFVLLLPETNSEQAQAVVNKLREKLQFEMISEDWPVTFSMGVISCSTPPKTIDEMLKLADNLMYEVKKSGKNSVRFKELGREGSVDDLEAMAVLSRKMIFD